MKLLLATTALAISFGLPALAAGSQTEADAPKADSVTGTDITNDAAKQAEGYAADGPKADSVTGDDITDRANEQSEGYAADSPKADSVVGDDIKTETN
ncbi:hypothetical protein [Sedimentitalea arenosa]|jgi:hypothetical protein|uniref:Uncharacterized protein n=1 Tax=Sedimentitalea arenosa TaxID=2798803 RepID=A0A8J7JHA8_9RHOB|nr:hypothetical protein [Arenibacterium arenosum]MBJ6372154.1 hypothetical protein [Arenibacterium arenosum]